MNSKKPIRNVTVLQLVGIMILTSNVILEKSVKAFSRQILAAITATLFAVSNGITYGWTSPMIPYLLGEESHIKTTEYEAEWLELALLCGSLGGLPLTIYSVDKYGRKKSLLFACLTILIGWLFIIFGDKMAYLFVGRFMCGMADDMAFVACPMYMAEISDQKIRGLLGGIIYIMVHTGTLIIYCVGPFTPYYVSPVIGSIMVLTELVLFYFVPESPYYLLYKNKEEEARKSLEFFKPYSNVDEEVSEIKQMLEKQTADRGRVQDLILVKSNRKAITILTVLNAGQHLCAYTVILMNLHLILESAGSIYIESSYAAIIFGAVMLIATMLSSLCVDKYGRRGLMMISSIVTGICLLALAVYFHLKYLNINVTGVSWIPIASVMIYACFFKLGLGIVPIILTGEIFPTNIKAKGVAVADAMFILGGIIAIQIYQSLSRVLDIFVPFYIFGAYAIFLVLFTYFIIPETKGRSLDEIQNILKGEPIQSIEPKKQQEG